MRDRIEIKATKMGLREIEKSGSNMKIPLEMDFFISVTSESDGIKIADIVRGHDFEVVVKEDSKLGQWTCCCTKSIIPSLENVLNIEVMLNEIAQNFNGFSDGFGSFGNA